jgi:hypothetical protein
MFKDSLPNQEGVVNLWNSWNLDIWGYTVIRCCLEACVVKINHLLEAPRDLKLETPRGDEPLCESFASSSVQNSSFLTQMAYRDALLRR